jgi:endonuclease/exonuclease/phosphatase family metal-dependent hydrolase
MIAKIEHFLHRLRSRISRSEWAVRHFGFLGTEAARNRPGLALIQIDGLSHTQMQRAMAAGRLPFLKSLLNKEEYQASRMYSGLPSSTPAAQAELFYGVRRAVPAFCFYDAACERIFSMFEGDDAREIEKKLRSSGEPLLKDGSAYGNIYDGGAAEAHFCMTEYGWPDILRKSSPPMVALLALLHIPSLLRILVLLAVEFFLALGDFFRGLIARQNLWAEMKFIPSRVGVCIVMRELLVMRAGIDLQRGLPIVQLNFLGYDEQAHRRGPDSRFAHWSLKGIDDAVKRVFRAARRSRRRDYDVWIYSDHGQSRVQSYQTKTGETVQAAISRVFDQTFSDSDGPPHGVQFQRARLLRTPRHRPETQPPDRLPIVTALGPLGYVYLGRSVSDEERVHMGERLAHEASIPLAMAKDGEGKATAWTASGCYQLPRDAADVLGRDHPYLKETATDLVSLCHHQDAGDFLIAGWADGQTPLSFPLEKGAHGGPTPEETSAFAILPPDIPLPLHGQTLRLLHIRQAAQTLLAGRQAVGQIDVPSVSAGDTLRILTYNVHSCSGMDGMISPHRIARVIEREAPDIIALQEVDVMRPRTDSDDQARLLARYLSMHVHFHPALQIEGEQYGEAVLSRFPMTLRRAGALPYRKHWLVDESRGALWVEIDLGAGRRLQLVNTHFGLGGRERRDQVETLLGPDWLGHDDCRGAVVLCGDFNASPKSYVHQRLGSRLRDVQDVLPGHQRLKTLPGRHPYGYIDHVFVGERIEPAAIHVPLHHLARVSSDHLPLVVDLRMAADGNTDSA